MEQSKNLDTLETYQPTSYSQQFSCQRISGCLVLSKNSGCLEGAWIQGTYFSLTKNSLFKRLKFQAPLTKEGLKLVLRLIFLVRGTPTKMWISPLSPHLTPLL